MCKYSGLRQSVKRNNGGEDTSKPHTQKVSTISKLLRCDVEIHPRPSPVCYSVVVQVMMAAPGLTLLSITCIGPTDVDQEQNTVTDCEIEAGFRSAVE